MTDPRPRMVRTEIELLGGLASATGLTRHLKVRRQRVDTLSRLPDFPTPVPIEGGGRVWFVAEVLAWRAERLRSPRGMA